LKKYLIDLYFVMRMIFGLYHRASNDFDRNHQIFNLLD
jgi:hypothetical protein